MRPNRSTVTLAELLLEENKVVPWQLQDARNYQERKGGTLAKALVRLGFVRDGEITDLLGRQYGLPSIDLDPLTIDPAILRIVPEEMARTHKVLPLSRSGATLTLAMADPTNVLALDDVRLTTGCRVEPVVTSEAGLEDAIDLCYGPPRSAGRRRERRARRGLREERADRLAVRDRDARGRAGRRAAPHPRHGRGRGGHAGAADPGARRGAGSCRGAGATARRSHRCTAQPRRSGLGRAPVRERATCA